MCGADGASDETQRAELKRQRDAIDANHAQREETCRSQFVVTPCLEKARVDKQEALQTVRTQERALDDMQRRQRAEEQARRVTGKAQAAASRERLATPHEPKARSQVEPKPAKPRSEKASPQKSQAEAQHKRADFEARQREIEAHREAVEKRNAERAARKTPIPLPVPGSAAAP